MSTTYHVLIPTNACIRGSKFKSVSMPGDASDIESLSSWSSSRLIKDSRFLLYYRAKRYRTSDNITSVRLYPNIKATKGVSTLETLFSDHDTKQSQGVRGLMDLDPIDKMAYIYKLCKQILEALKELYKVLTTLRKKDPDIPYSHGLLTPSSIYRYPNGQLKLTFYGLRTDSQSDNIYCDLQSLASIYSKLCTKLLVEPDPSFNATVEKLRSSDRVCQLKTILDFVEARLSKLSGSSGIVGHLIPPSDIEGSIKDGANELALPSSIEVDELEKSSTTGISASARSLHSISDSASTLCPSGETTTMLLESGILIPAKCLDQIHQHYSYPAGQTNPEGLCSIDDGYTMTILLTALQDIQMVCPYLTYFSILSSKHPIQEMKKSISEGNVLQIFTMDNVFEMLRDLSQSTPIMHETLARQEIVLQILKIAFTGASQSEEYGSMDDAKRALLHANMPRFIKFMIQDVNLHPYIMVTDPNLKSREVMEKEIWGLIDKGVECYLSLIAGRGWLCNEAEKGDTTSPKQSTEIANSCITCLKSYLHVAIISYSESFTDQIDTSEACMSIALKCVKLSIFETTFLMYFHSKRCSHVLANNMVAALIKKDASQSSTCSAIECSCICGLLVVYLTSKGTKYLSSTLINELLFIITGCLETSIADASSEEYQKIPLIAKVLINYYVLYLSQCAIELIKESTGVEENIKRCFVCLNVFVSKLHKVLVSSSQQTSNQTHGGPDRYYLLVYIALDCLAKLFRCIGGIERLMVRWLENIYIGDEYAQVYRPICSREEPLFLSYSDLPSTAAQGIGGPAIWQMENCQQNKKKLLIIYRGTVDMLTPQFAELLKSVSRYPALSNSSIVHVRITVIQNVIIEALYTVMQHDSKASIQQYMKPMAALGLRGRLEALLCNSTRDIQSLRDSESKEERGLVGKSSNAASAVRDIYTHSTVRRIVDLHLGINETQTFYIRHLMCENNISRDDFVFDVGNITRWNKNVYLKAAESLQTNRSFATFLKVFDITPNMVFSVMAADTFYRNTPIELLKSDNDATVDFRDMPV